MRARFVHALRNKDICAELRSIFQDIEEDVEENRQCIELLENEVECLRGRGGISVRRYFRDYFLSMYLSHAAVFH